MEPHMPFRRWLLLMAFSSLLCGCHDRSLEQSADEIRQYSDQEDRAYTLEAIRQIEHRYWTLHGHAWYGKLADGSIDRLDEPKATAAPLPSRAFYSGWHLQLTISSDDWRTYPPSQYDGAFQAVYAMTRRGPGNWEIDVTSGPATTPLRHGDAERVEAADN